MAWYHPEWYHRVISYSGTLVNQQSPFDAQTPDGAIEDEAGGAPRPRMQPREDGVLGPPVEEVARRGPVAERGRGFDQTMTMRSASS
jgi:hypothetical protein